MADGTFAAKLRAELTSRKMGVKTLARLISPGNVDNTRRQLNRWLSGTVPTQPSRDLVTDALGLERGALDPDDDEESEAVVVDVGGTLFRIAVLRPRELVSA